MNKKVEHYDVIIIGGGPAGLTAGIYCGRARLKTLIIEKALIGGLATYTNEIENFSGFPEGITGLELTKRFHKQAQKFGVDFKLTPVKKVDLQNDLKIVETFKTNYMAKSVIIASGGKPRLTGAKNETLFLYDKGISFCATCDAAANTDKTVMIIGSGDAAIEEGLFLTKFAKKVIISVIHDPGKMDCNEIAKSQALSNPKIEFLWNTTVESFKGNGHLDTVVLKTTKTDELISISVDSCFLFIGYLPNTEIFTHKLQMNSNGYLITNEKMETNIPGVFAAGDVRDKFLRQVATAVGDGAIAGYNAEKYITEKEIFKDQILNNGNPSVVYLYNAINPQGRELLSVLESFEKKYDHVGVSKIDVYKSDTIAKKLGINTFPSVVFINNNVIVGTIEGNITANELQNLLQ